MSMTQLEKVLAESLAKCTQVNIPEIIEAAQAACIGGCNTVATTTVAVVETPAKVEKPKAAAAKKPVAEPPPVVETVAPPTVEQTPPPPVKQEPPPAVTAGVNLTGLFTGSGADKKVVKDVFLAAVEQAKSLAHLVALNATCDCGFATGDYTEETAPVLKRKLARWGAAQE